ncbi:MAG: thioredoxin family protein [Legionellales bacterium]|nr:thioredoxin family protein [Legionellales bacterium]
MTKNIIEVNSVNLPGLLDETGLLILDFWNERCAPCKAFSQSIEVVAQKYPGVTFGKINTDAEPDLAAKFGVRAVPHIVFLRENVMLYSDAGLLSAIVLSQMIDDAMAVDISKIKEHTSDAE